MAGVRLIDGIAVFGDEAVDPGVLQQTKRAQKHAAQVALMADRQVGYGVPVGGVVGYVGSISPTGVGVDIACGNLAARLDMTRRDLLDGIGIDRAMDLIWGTLSFGPGRKNSERVDHSLFDSAAWQVPAYGALRDMAAEQLGTIGGGNHYADLLVDEFDRIWVGVHFGSRGLGFRIAKHTMAAAGAMDGVHVEPLVLSVHCDLGQEYLVGMELAGEYAYAGREWVVRKIARLLGAFIVEEVHNNHNYAWPENHGGQDMWVVRKGATPAWPGQRGFVGGSMGDISVIIEGTLDEVAFMDGVTPNELAMFSTVHGAGRLMSRTAAKGKQQRRWVPNPDVQAERERLEGSVKLLPRGSAERRAAGKRIQELIQDRVHGLWDVKVSQAGAVTAEAMQERLARAGVVLRGGDVEEAPQVYRDLETVLAAHAGTIRALHTLRPLGVAMAGEDDQDPYKD